MDPAGNQTVNSRLLVRRQKMHGSQRCYGELMELTVDNIWQIADAGDQNFEYWNGEVPSLELGNSLRNIQPVHQPRQTTLLFPGPSHQTCCSILLYCYYFSCYRYGEKNEYILNMLQLVYGLIRRGRQNTVAIVDA